MGPGGLSLPPQFFLTKITLIFHTTYIYSEKKFAINYNKKDDTKYRIPLAALLSGQDISGKFNNYRIRTRKQ